MSNQASSGDERSPYEKPVMIAVELAFEDDVLGSGPSDGSEDLLDLFGDF